MKYGNYLEDYACLTDKGRVRINNEDAVTILRNDKEDVLLIVADGLGGHNMGELASSLAIDIISDSFKNKRYFSSIYAAKIWVTTVIKKVNSLIYKKASTNPSYEGMGTTIVLILIHKEDLVLLNIGDSRAYFVKDNCLELISEDQSYVSYLERTGQISKEEAKNREDKNVLLSALGTFPSLNFNIRIIHKFKNPLFLCSDGVYNTLSDEEILKTLKLNKEASAIVKDLIDKANNNGSNDNISVCYYRRKYND